MIANTTRFKKEKKQL